MAMYESIPSYQHSMDRGYSEPEIPAKWPEEVLDKEVSKPMIPLKDVGFTVTEGGRFGKFSQSVQAYIRSGAAKLELATGMGGGQEPLGAESYGQDTREELREIAKANEVEFTAVHAPTQIGNMSGFLPQQKSFEDEFRKTAVEEIKQAITFAGDVARGGAVVVHTGEFQRPIDDAFWNKDKQFLGYEEEPSRAITYMVDDRTGKVMSDVRKSQIVYEPEYKLAEEAYTDKNDHQVKEGDYIDVDGCYLNPINKDDLFRRVPKWDKENSRFQTVRLTWDDFEQRAKEWNKKYPDDPKRPEEMFFKIQLENQILSSKGHSLFYARHYEDSKKLRDKAVEALEFYESLEKDLPENEKWKIMEEQGYGGGVLGKLIPSERKLPSEILKETIRERTQDLIHIHQASAAADTQADTYEEMLEHVQPINKYGKKQTFKSLAELGIDAMEESHHNPYVKKDIFVAPENIFPEMGYGSHPEELIEMIQGAREVMVDRLTSKYIEDPHGIRDEKGNVREVPNPFYRGWSKDRAMTEAKKHIRATFDTQHLGMWRKYFQPKPGETKDESDKRFNKWFMEEVKKMEQADIIGHMHAVDAIGSGHQHLPIGQGRLPVTDAITYLRNKGLNFTISSEGHGEGSDRQIRETWKALGSPLFRDGMPRPPMGGGRTGWTDINQSYFGTHRPPYYVFGAYSPSEDWTLWSAVPME
ncbi:MAG: hypothetical protein ABIE94_02270 [archaeon]